MTTSTLTSIDGIKGSSIRMKASKACAGDWLRRNGITSRYEWKLISEVGFSGRSVVYTFADGTMDHRHFARPVIIFRPLEESGDTSPRRYI
ncbi:MAG: hypothetical protein ACYS7Y_28695 [Planctomycetota bacterium]|jgi:hypothetical protein